jgi:hypothetical protein
MPGWLPTPLSYAVLICVWPSTAGQATFILRTPLLNLQGIAELTGDANLDGARTPAMLFGSDPLPVPLALADD